MNRINFDEIDEALDLVEWNSEPDLELVEWNSEPDLNSSDSTEWFTFDSICNTLDDW